MEYKIVKGRCECGLGKESGIPCSHELLMYREGRITELNL